MTRYHFYWYISVAVILLGLLIFFNMSGAVRFFHMQIFNGVSPFVRLLNMSRLWGSKALLSEQITRGELQRDDEKKLESAQATIQELTHENDRLRSTLGFKDKNKINLKGVSVVYYGRELGKEYLLIDREGNENINKGDIVVDADSLLIGTVKDVENSFVKVGIASNRDDVFDAELLPSGVNTFAKGLGNHTFSLELVPQNAVVRMGDYVMMKGNKMPFLLGEVIRVETNGTGAFKEVRAVLASHPEWEEEVFIVSGKF